MSGDARVWITRAQPGADATAARVAALGFTPVVAPLLEVRLLAPEIDLKDVGALAFTSANGVRAFATLSSERVLPVFTVGDATAEAARGAGFAQVASARGDVEALAALIATDPPRGPVLHPAASRPAGDLCGDLTAAGVACRAVAVYDTVPTSTDSDAGADARAVLLHSPRAAALLAGLIAGAGRPGLQAVCLSPAVAAQLAAAPLAAVAVAERPDEAALLARLAEIAR